MNKFRHIRNKFSTRFCFLWQKCRWNLLPKMISCFGHLSYCEQLPYETNSISILDEMKTVNALPHLNTIEKNAPQSVGGSAEEGVVNLAGMRGGEHRAMIGWFGRTHPFLNNCRAVCVVGANDFNFVEMPTLAVRGVSETYAGRKNPKTLRIRSNGQTTRNLFLTSKHRIQP